MKNSVLQTKVIIAFVLLCVVMVFFITNHFIYWNGLIIIVDIVYITLCIALLYFLYKLIKKYSYQSNFIKRYFQVIFMTLSILVVIGYSETTINVIDTYVVPKPVNCTFVDKQGYYLEETFGWDGSCNLEIVDYITDSSGDLEYLELYHKDDNPLKDVRLTRNYEEGRLITSSYEIPSREEYLNFYYDIQLPFGDVIEPDKLNIIFEYEYIYGDNEFTMLLNEIYSYNNEVWKTYYRGTHYVFNDGDITANRLSGTKYNESYNLNEENYKDFVVNKVTTYVNQMDYDQDEKSAFLETLESSVDEILEKRNSFYTMLLDSDKYTSHDRQGLDIWYEYPMYQLDQINDINSEYYQQYLVEYVEPLYTEKYTDTYINSVLFPMSFNNEIVNHPYYEYKDGYLMKYNNIIEDTQNDFTHTFYESEFTYKSKDGVIEYIDEYINDQLLQRIKIVDLGVLTRIETYHYEGYNVGFNKQVLGVGGPHATYYINNNDDFNVSWIFQDYVSENQYIMIIEPVNIIELVVED